MTCLKNFRNYHLFTTSDINKCNVSFRNCEGSSVSIGHTQTSLLCRSHWLVGHLDLKIALFRPLEWHTFSYFVYSYVWIRLFPERLKMCLCKIKGNILLVKRTGEEIGEKPFVRSACRIKSMQRMLTALLIAFGFNAESEKTFSIAMPFKVLAFPKLFTFLNVSIIWRFDVFSPNSRSYFPFYSPKIKCIEWQWNLVRKSIGCARKVCNFNWIRAAMLASCAILRQINASSAQNSIYYSTI